MAKSELRGIFSLAAAREQEQAAKEARAAEKAERKSDYKNRSKDAVLTLDIEGKNQGFRDNESRIGNFFKSAKEGMTSVFGKFREKWSKRNMPETMSVVPQEDTTQGRYEAVMKTAQALETTTETKMASIQKDGEGLQGQQGALDAITAEAGASAVSAEAPPPSKTRSNIIQFPGRFSVEAGAKNNNSEIGLIKSEQKAVLEETVTILQKYYTEQSSTPEWLKKLSNKQELTPREINEGVFALEEISQIKGWSDEEYIALIRAKTILEAKETHNYSLDKAA